MVKEYWDTTDPGCPNPVPTDGSVVTNAPNTHSYGGATLKALFDSTHFMDSTMIVLKIKVWDSNGGYYDGTIQGPAYNKACVLVNGGSPLPIPGSTSQISVTDFTYADQTLHDVKSSALAMKHDVTPSKTATKSEILTDIFTQTAFFINTHGISLPTALTSPITGVSLPAGVYFGDCTVISKDPNLLSKMIGFYEVSNIVSNRNTAFIPPYNFVYIDACQGAGNEPRIDTSMADAFGVKTRADAAYFGFGNNKDENGNLDPLYTSVTVIGDYKMQLHGVYKGGGLDWYKPL